MNLKITQLTKYPVLGKDKIRYTKLTDVNSFEFQMINDNPLLIVWDSSNKPMEFEEVIYFENY